MAGWKNSGDTPVRLYRSGTAISLERNVGCDGKTITPVLRRLSQGEMANAILAVTEILSLGRSRPARLLLRNPGL
jgi:hypothetical protein